MCFLKNCLVSVATGLFVTASSSHHSWSKLPSMVLKPGPELYYLPRITTTQQEQFNELKLQIFQAQFVTRGISFWVECLIFVPVWKGKFLIAEYVGEFRL